MQVLISCALPLRALATHHGSASSGRAIDTMSAPPEARMRSATSGMLMRLVATSGSATCGRSFAVTPANAPRGTEDRKSVVKGKSVSVRVDLGGRRNLKKKQNYNNTQHHTQ